MKGRGSADIMVTYNVQGSGRGQVVETYHYTEKTLMLESTMMNGGKARFEWFRLNEEANRAVEGSGDPRAARPSRKELNKTQATWSKHRRQS